MSNSKPLRKKRFRTSSKILPFNASYRWFNGSSWFTMTKAFAATDSSAGLSNPNWEKLVESGLDAGSAYDRTITYKIRRNPVVDLEWTQWKDALKKSFYTYKIQGNFPLYSMRQDFTFAAPDVSALEARAKLSFLKKINEENSPFKALPFIGELNETIEMLRHPLKGLARHTRRYASTVRKNQVRLKKAGHISDLLTEMYLEWTYGVSPLIGDIKAGYVAYQKLLSEGTADIPIYAVAKDLFIGSNGKTVVPYSSVPVWVYHNYMAEVKVQLKGALKHDTSPASIPDLLGLSLNEFVPTLWELLPYSFLVDYVTNVGDVIGGAFTSTAGLRWYWQSVKTIRTRTNYLVPMPTDGLCRTFPKDLSTCVLENRTFKRSKPSLSVSLRDFEYNLPTLGQEVNAFALALSQVRRSISRR